MKPASPSIVLASVIALACLSPGANAQEAAEPQPLKLAAQTKPLPKFKDYPAGRIFKGKPARPRLVTQRLRYERSYFESIAEKGATFAGHYTIVELPCGTTCRAPNILDLRTGRVIPWDTISGWREYHDDFEPVIVKPDSRLIVFAGALREKPPVGYHYYVLENGKLRFLRTVVTDGIFMEPLPME